MGVLLVLLIRAVLGGISAMIANSKGRSTVGWFFAGALIGLIAIIIVLCLDDLEEKKQFKRKMRNKNRRMKEKLRQEKKKNEAFQHHAKKRLDKHDRELGIDTRDAGTRTLEGATASTDQIEGPDREPSPDREPPNDNKKWYYELEDEVYGPVDREVILHMLENGTLTESTNIRRTGMENWKEIASIPGFVES